jgi:TonB family protein
MLAVPPCSAAAPATSAQVWQVDWEDSQCTISTGDPASFFLSLRVTPGDPRPSLYVLAPAARLKGTGDGVKITLPPSAKSFRQSSSVAPSTNGAGVLKVYGLKEDFTPAFAAASEVRLTGLGEPVSIPVANADQAMAALKDCVDLKLSGWGIDAKAYEALRAPPIDPGDHDWFSAMDYPSAAQQAGQSGDVIARITVNAKGKVTDCVVVVSSNSPPLDEIACAKTLKSARFIPAVGSDGKPTAAMRTTRVIFRLMD